jgi:translocation and assembly module TamB
VKHVKRILSIVLAVGGGALALALAAAVFVLFTEAGSRLALSIANKRSLPIKARAIHGTLAHRVVILGAEVHIGPVNATADTVVVSWRPLELRSRHIAVTDVEVAGAHIMVVPAATPGATPAKPNNEKTRKPWIFDAEHVRVRNTKLDAPGNVHLRDVNITASGRHDGYRAVAQFTGSVWRFDTVRAFMRAEGNTKAATADSLEVDVLGGVVHGNAFVRWSPGLSWRARIAGDSVHIGEMMSKPEEWPGTLTFRVRGTGIVHDDTLRVGADLQSLSGTLRNRPAFARGRVDIDGKTIAASDMRVRWGRASASLSGSMADSANVRLDATVPSLAEILPRASGSGRVRGTITGTRERVNVAVDAGASGVRVAGWSAPGVTANIRAALAAEDYRPYSVEVQRAEVHVAGGWLETRGHASWKNGIEWNARVAATNIETSALTPPKWNLSGPLSMLITSSGAKRGRSLSGELMIGSLSGNVRNRAVSGAGRVVVKNREADLSDFFVQWGRTHLRADGHAGKELALDVDLAAPDLAALVPSWHGAVTLKGSAKGKLPRPAINATIDADSLHLHGYGAMRVNGHVAFDPTFAAPADIDITALGAVRGATVLDTVRVVATGPRDGHRVSLAVARGKLAGSITLAGALSDSSWSGVVDDMRLRVPTTGEWRARGRAPLYLSHTRAALDSLVLVSGHSDLTLHGSWRRGGAAAGALALNGFPLAVLQEYLHGATISGVVNGTATFAKKPREGIDAKADFTAGPGEFAMGQQRIAYNANVHALAARDGVSTHVDAALETGNQKVATVNGEVSIPGFVAGLDSLGGHAVQGQIDLECSDIGPVLAVFAPDLSNASGTLTANLAPKGTTDSFKLLGRAALEKARFDTRDGLRLRNIDLALVSDGEGKVTLDGGVTSGGGRINIAASSARSEQGWVSGTFSAKGERFQVMNRPDARVFISPDINLNVKERNALITGTVRVPYARIETSEVPASAVSPSPDVVIVEDTLATKPKVQVRTQVRVALGDSVSFSGFGLNARLAGSLAVDDERGRPTQGTGEIQLINGKYRAFGNELTIDPGRLVFGGGPIDNPGVDVRAYRGLTTQNVVASTGEMVGVNVRGTLRKPVVSVFSNPPMSQNEIMSYLLTGHAPTSGDQSAMAGVAMLLAMQQGQQVAGDIGKKLSLDTYLETGTEAGEASFVAGKYLSPKLYVSYAAGLFEHTNTFRTRYSLTGHWTLQAESGKYDSTDLLYWFERGK